MIYLQLAGRVLLFLAGLAIVAATLGSSVRTVILPPGERFVSSAGLCSWWSGSSMDTDRPPGKL